MGYRIILENEEKGQLTAQEQTGTAVRKINKGYKKLKNEKQFRKGSFRRLEVGSCDLEKKKGPKGKA